MIRRGGVALLTLSPIAWAAAQSTGPAGAASAPVSTPTSAAASEPASGPTSAPAKEELAELLHSYFTETNARRREAVGESIEELVQGNVRAVAEALGGVQLWEPRKPGNDRFDIVTPAATTAVLVRVPPGYDATRGYPLIIALHGQGGKAEHIIHFVLASLGEKRDEYLIAAPQDYKGAWFNCPPEEAGDPVVLMNQLLRRYHVDTERVYVVGYSMGGHGAFTLATFYTDYFAAAIPMAGTLVVQYSLPTYRLLVPNWRHLPVLAVWGAHDLGDERNERAAGGGIAGQNKLLRLAAAEAEVPFKPVELADKGHRDVDPPAELFVEYLQKRRAPAPKAVYHTFRYPEQGRASWLRQRRFGGKPWDGQALSIVITGPTDTDAYVTEVMTKKLAHLGGTIEGQTIRVDIRRTAEVEVLLNGDLVSLDEPIRLVVDETTRFEGKVQPRVLTMLEIAFEDWDFQRLYPVRLVMKARSPARQE